MKINCTLLVAIHNISLHTSLGKGGGSNSELYNWSKQIFKTSPSGMLLNKLLISNETIKLFGLKISKLLSLFTKVNESGTVWFENLSSTGCNTETKKVD